MWTSTEDCFCQEHVRQRRSPNSWAAQRRTSSADRASSSESVSESCALTEQDLLEGVGAEPETERLERDDFLGRDVAEVDLGPEAADEPGLGGLLRRLEDDVADLDLVDDLVDQAGAHLAGGT